MKRWLRSGWSATSGLKGGFSHKSNLLQEACKLPLCAARQGATEDEEPACAATALVSLGQPVPGI